MKDEHGETMSKSKGNVIAPEDMIAEYGADAVRAYILFMAPPDKDLLWDEGGLAGIYKFMNRAWRIVCDLAGQAGEDSLFYPGVSVEDGKKAASALNRERHRVVGKVACDFDRNNFNTAIAAIMELCNAAGDYLRKVSPEVRAECEHLRALDADVACVIVKLLAPIAPHWAEELWHAVLGHDDSVHVQPWPEFDPEQAKADQVELAVQVNGKVKAHVRCGRCRRRRYRRRRPCRPDRRYRGQGRQEGRGGSRPLGKHCGEVGLSMTNRKGSHCYGIEARSRRMRIRLWGSGFALIAWNLP